MSEVKGIIRVYGTTWCGDSRRARKILDENNVDYEWIDIDQDTAAAEYVKSVNRGCRSVPTILFPDGSMLVEPSFNELMAKINLT